MHMTTAAVGCTFVHLSLVCSGVGFGPAPDYGTVCRTGVGDGGRAAGGRTGDGDGDNGLAAGRVAAVWRWWRTGTSSPDIEGGGSYHLSHSWQDWISDQFGSYNSSGVAPVRGAATPNPLAWHVFSI